MFRKTAMFVFTVALLHSSSVLFSQGRQAPVQFTEEDVANLTDESVESKLIRAVSAALAVNSDLNDFDEEDGKAAQYRDEYYDEYYRNGDDEYIV